ncbi:hypothetical protein San01_02340 [Streptomyces angustmyceticus]|uniref:Uncharacterized protein n=1 Tax=Streptomyces angustmyceticus TaxID=285578 RepID=A0A5J4L022_9ACTN|nr:hypothetical protein San01_02340 [Streptomyces angustmyceticus]
MSRRRPSRPAQADEATGKTTAQASRQALHMAACEAAEWRVRRCAVERVPAVPGPASLCRATHGRPEGERAAGCGRQTGEMRGRSAD